MGWVLSSTSDQGKLYAYISGGTIVLVGTLMIGELSHVALPPHAATGYEGGANVIREKVVTITSTSSANSSIGTAFSGF